MTACGGGVIEGVGDWLGELDGVAPVDSVADGVGVAELEGVCDGVCEELNDVDGVPVDEGSGGGGMYCSCSHTNVRVCVSLAEEHDADINVPA